MTIQSNPAEFIKQKTFAIIGASQNRSKYGNIVYRNLRAKGYKLFAVNPNTGTVEGDPCYTDIASLPEIVDGIVTVVPPSVTEKTVREAYAAGITRVWMQEGSESEDAIQYCRERGINVVYDQCIMVVTNYASLTDRAE
ncbi:MAG: CoA-binding protein [Bacteroidota bacterium]